MAENKTKNIVRFFKNTKAYFGGIGCQNINCSINKKSIAFFPAEGISPHDHIQLEVPHIQKTAA